MTIEAKIIADSISPAGKRITTLQLTYPRFIHAEFMTHRVFSRNASSSRAIPVTKMIEQVRNNPAMPIHWGLNQPGMQANTQLAPSDRIDAEHLWMSAAHCAAGIAEDMTRLGLHKQVANRILEPFQHIHVVVTATEFANFFELRAHKDAQPEIHELAIQMMLAMDASTPKLLQPGEWHLPYVDEATWRAVELHLINKWPENASLRTKDDVVGLLKQVSAARCCRVSYLKHDGTNSTIAEDLELCDKLIGAKPLHASPFEHQATPDRATYVVADNHLTDEWIQPELHGNFIGWIQHRKLIEDRFR